MQLQLPIFPKEARLINEHVGVYQKDGIAQYIVNGVPVYSHAEGEINAFRFICEAWYSSCPGYFVDYFIWLEIEKFVK
jgi:hypothetical protein